MAYDPILARARIKAAATYERLPGSEFISELAKLLEAADQEIRDFSKKTTLIEDDARRYQREAQDEREALRKLREGAGRNYEIALSALKEIAASTKGGKKKAQEALDAISPPAATPEPQAPTA